MILTDCLKGTKQLFRDGQFRVALPMIVDPRYPLRPDVWTTEAMEDTSSFHVISADRNDFWRREDGKILKDAELHWMRQQLFNIKLIKPSNTLKQPSKKHHTKQLPKNHQKSIKHSSNKYRKSIKTTEQPKNNQLKHQKPSKATENIKEASKK